MSFSWLICGLLALFVVILMIGRLDWKKWTSRFAVGSKCLFCSFSAVVACISLVFCLFVPVDLEKLPPFAAFFLEYRTIICVIAAFCLVTSILLLILKIIGEALLKRNSENFPCIVELVETVQRKFQLDDDYNSPEVRVYLLRAKSKRKLVSFISCPLDEAGRIDYKVEYVDGEENNDPLPVECWKKARQKGKAPDRGEFSYRPNSLWQGVDKWGRSAIAFPVFTSDKDHRPWGVLFIQFSVLVAPKGRNKALKDLRDKAGLVGVIEGVLHNGKNCNLLRIGLG